MADVEEYFPRGGKKPTTTNFVQTSNFLGTADKKDKRKKYKRKTEVDDGYLSEEASKDTNTSYKTCGVWLSYKAMKEDFTVLGRISEVKQTKILISLPSRLIGTVMACHISEAYNKLLEAYVDDKVEKVTELTQMFKRGQYVSVKVLEIQEKHAMLTMMPQHVNSTRNHSSLHKGTLLQVAVSSVEDHGYIMETGIPNTTAFLPKKGVNPGLQLEEGMLIWCSIKSIKASVDNSVITLTNETEALRNAFQRNSTTTIPPGTALEFEVEKPLNNGIEGRIFGDRTAYIQRHHIDTNAKKPALGAKIRARLLYTLSATNIPYLTMRDIFDPACLDMAQEQVYKDGDIVEDAQVLKILGRVIYFKLSSGQTGVLSVRRLQMHEDLTDEQILAKSYATGSQHVVRILGYHLLDHVYSVTDQADLVQEKYFNYTQLNVGEILNATVSLVTDTYLKATAGRITCFVPQSHMTDSGIFVDPKKASTSKLPKKKFKVGQEIKGRVLYLDHSLKNAVLTLKPTLLLPDTPVLLKIEDAVEGRSYSAVVTTIREYLLVSFFDNIKALIPRKFVSKQPLENLADSFHVGQLVTCVLVSVNIEEKKIIASLTHEPFDSTKKKIKRKEVLLDDNKHEDLSEKKSKKRKAFEEENDSAQSHENKNERSSKKKIKLLNDKEQEKTEMSDNEEADEANVEETKEKSKKKKNKEKQNTEESDAIESDIPDNKSNTIYAKDRELMDITSCNTSEDYKTRLSELLKSVNRKVKFLNRIENKIEKLENKGLNPKNKKYHTDLHIEKLTTQEFITELLDTIKIIQEKIKLLGNSDDKIETKNQDEIKKRSGTLQSSENNEEVENEKISINKIKNVKVVAKLQPVIEVPSAKDFWSDTQALKSKEEEESSSSEDEEQEKPKKKRKKLSAAEKVAKAREEEERIREMEKRAIESENEPRSVEQFQRALLASPDCSQLWIAYMAFHLQATEIERARGVARKAFTTINFREEQERLNVWIALLNLEHRFGTKETQQKTLEEALQMNDRYQVHSKLLDILVDTSKHQELIQLVELMQRKYRQQLEMYTACGNACYKAGLVDKARQLMQKGMTALEKKQHVALLVQFAQLERAHGERERAEALFEQVLAVYPARVDVCCVYVDMLLKTGDVTRIRQVLERMTAHKLPARKMKVLFKKWIEVEEKYGDKDQAEQIRQKALEYVDQAKF